MGIYRHGMFTIFAVMVRKTQRTNVSDEENYLQDSLKDNYHTPKHFNTHESI